MILSGVFALASVASAMGVPRTDDDPNRYTVCGGDRGYVVNDSLIAANDLVNKVVTSDTYFMAKENCIYSSYNTTIISLCNGSARDRHINRAETQRGIDQLIKDCGLKGGFTGFHVVNNLTFGAFGTSGGVKSAEPRPPGSPPPDFPGSASSRRFGSSNLSTSRRNALQSNMRSKNALRARKLEDDGNNCALDHDGVWRDNCDWKYKLWDDGSCDGEFLIENDCQAYCELWRRKLLGPETKAPGVGGEQTIAGTALVLGESEEYSVSASFSITAEGIFKEVFGAGVGFSYTTTTTKGSTIERSASDEDAPEVPGYEKGLYRRWVFFPVLIETWGTVSWAATVDQSECPGDCPPNLICSDPPQIIQTDEDQHSLTPKLDSNGQPVAIWVVRWEFGNGTALDWEYQTTSYQNLCWSGTDPDDDGENECFTQVGDRAAPVNFELPVKG